MKRMNLLVKKKSISTKVFLSFGLLFSTLLLFKTTHRVENRVIASVAPIVQVVPATVSVTTAVAPVAVAPVAKVVVTKTDELTDLEKKFNDQKIVGIESFEREKNSKAIRITLNSDVFFQLGTAKIEEASKESIQQFISILKPISSNGFIEIEGHTDDSPVIHQKPNYPSNWELSAARAASFIPLFSNNGFFKDQLKVIGYGDSHPLFSNHVSPKISAKNRRIVLRIYTQEDERKI